jgi:alginate O-acetyltransferase complex protein AlgJ
MAALRFPTLNRSTLFTLAMVLLLALPAGTAWNLFARSFAPKLEIRIGRALRGVVEEPTPFQWSWQAFKDGSNQKAIAREVSEAIPLRRVLVRVNNQIRFKLYGAFGAPGIVRGEKGYLFEKAYIDEFCARDLSDLAARAPSWIANLKELQDFFASRGKTFIYVVTPSKATHFPELFAHRIACASTPAAREQKLPRYLAMLRDAGINVFDTATPTHRLKGKYPFDIFPPTGTHWNAVGLTEATNLIIAEISRRTNRQIPQLRYDYVVADNVTGMDRDLLNVVNLLLPVPKFPVARVTYQPLACENNPASKLKVSVVGGSFIDSVSATLVRQGCFSDLGNYNYLYRGLRGGPGYRLLKTRLTPADIPAIAESDVVILEENESVFPRSAHAEEFYKRLLGKN